MKRKAFRFFALALLMAAVLIRSTECAAGAKRGIETALSVLIPAFFLFLILFSLFSRAIEKPRPGWFFLLSILGGYPAAAAALAFCAGKEAFHEKDAGALVCCCFHPGCRFPFRRSHSFYSSGFI